MAYYETSRTGAHTSLRRAFRILLGEILAWREDADSRHRLGRLSDRELSDIGLNRSDLELSRRDDLRGA
ncbi:DUF1127 domain-containing protein [Tropicimonas aquimaris]|uniref:DUF1127 domain-containing protein n=1 Tax=Tropicimonas aquimaris TaxID=914152 RepID=A0ABW3IJ30_9RHOB